MGMKMGCSTEWYRKRKQHLVNLAGGKCEECGYDKCLSALTFAHRDSTDKRRVFNWLTWSSRKMLQKKYGLEKLIKEGKIRLLCFNCHMEETERKNEFVPLRFRK